MFVTYDDYLRSLEEWMDPTEAEYVCALCGRFALGDELFCRSCGGPLYEVERESPEEEG